MGRVAIIGVVLVALMVMAEATIFVDTDEELENRYSSGGQCRQELRGQRLHSCQRYIQRGGRGRGIGDLILRRGSEEEQSLEHCCRELRQVNERCRCQAIERSLERAQEERGGRSQDDDRQRDRDFDEQDRQGRFDEDRRGSSQDYDRRGSYSGEGGDQSQQRDHMVRRAQNLPQMCRLNRPQYCQIRERY